jgi:hypothetical protein
MCCLSIICLELQSSRQPIPGAMRRRLNGADAGWRAPGGAQRGTAHTAPPNRWYSGWLHSAGSLRCITKWQVRLLVRGLPGLD